MSDIVFIQTGGTIDKDYPRQSKGWAFEIGDPAVVRILDNLSPSFSYKIVELLKKDSLEISDDDRVSIVETIKQHPESNIVITHGTDTLIQTAAFLAKFDLQNVIVLTGSMRPEHFRNTDAHLNVGMALATVQRESPGVYICMHGIVGTWDQVSRNEQGKFILI